MTPTPATFTARNPTDLLAVVPFVLGFHPEDSVVLLTFGPGESFHARMDLPVVEHEQRQVARLLREVVGRHGAGRVALVLYTEDAGAAEAFAAVAVPPLLSAGVEVIDVIRTDGERFHHVGEPDDGGTAYDLSSHPYTADQVLRGRVVHERRSALADSLVGADDEDVAAVAAAADRTADRLIEVGKRPGTALGTPVGVRVPLQVALAGELRTEGRWLQRTLRRALAAPAEITSADAGRLLVLVALDSLREVAWAEIDRSGAGEHVELWRHLVRRAPRDLRPAPAALLAFSAWLRGEGALAWCALDRCFDVDPDDALGQHVAALLESATPPTVWAPIPQHALRVLAEDGSSRVSGRRGAS
ncbi:DUF4192 domain-containing protein [Marmoricola sp. RAF53]|uniref:DUF4192 domain-containing protein n=1 Tax=Marmoricola sp. RAF53 TaxID=3233059 RepID=UPI003F9C1313